MLIEVGPMAQQNVPQLPKGAERVVLTLAKREDRLDNILMEAVRQHESEKLRTLSRAGMKKLFTEGKIQIKGQRAKPSSAMAVGVTYVDILLG